MISAKSVRVISDDGSQLGVLPVQQAIELANGKGLDLVEVAPNADPPVCRVMDYGKYKYKTSKKVHETKKKGKAAQLKEIKVRPNTDEHDLETKIRNIRKFLVKKDRVKITLMFKGRELTYKESAIALLNRMAEEVKEDGAIEQAPKLEGRNMTILIVPK
ncbi:MAG: translation initiation factor IF-3 [Deltaproteobacteria bacterium]|nr:translation initiation factor IF-3 [Deltaproteobacteria bacterium]